MRVPVIKDFYGDGVNLYDKSWFDLKEGITVLIGCNGAGKTTLLHQIKEFCRKKNMQCLRYNNITDGGDNARQNALLTDRLSLLATLATSSEGEQITINISNIFAKIGEGIKNTKSGSNLVIVFDAVDSGLDITKIDEINDCFHNIIIPDAIDHKINLYVIISTNSYEFCISNNCLEINSLNYVSIKSYDKFVDLICKSKLRKTKRYDEISNLRKESKRQLDWRHDIEAEEAESIPKLKGSLRDNENSINVDLDKPTMYDYLALRTGGATITPVTYNTYNQSSTITSSPK